jgi:hypothetical protein
MLYCTLDYESHNLNLSFPEFLFPFKTILVAAAAAAVVLVSSFS